MNPSSETPATANPATAVDQPPLAQTPPTSPPPLLAAENPSTPAKAEPPLKPELIQISSVLGEIDYLSDAEQADYFACQTVIEMVCSSFVQIGLAFGRIRDLRLYRNEFDTFEAYCRQKWHYGHRYVNQLIGAAKIVTYLGAIRSLPRPEHETQVRPLLGLPPDQALAIWENAHKKAGDGKITERLVRSALHEQQRASGAALVDVKPRINKVEQRRLINEAFGQLLLLLSQKAAHDVLTEKLPRWPSTPCDLTIRSPNRRGSSPALCFRRGRS